MTPQTIVAALLVAAVVLGWVRLLLWQRGAGPAGSAGWRIAVLALLQPIVAGALFLALFPPPVVVGDDTLAVATAGTAPAAARAASGRLIALPEAPRLPDAVSVPDLATALRRYPATRRLIVLGRGLTPRDVDSARGLTVTFAAPEPAAGIVMLAPPARVAAGAEFRIAARARAPRDARMELVDPAGRVTDRQPLGPDGAAVLTGTARSAGATEFVLRLRDSAGALLEEAAVPVLVPAPARPRLLILAGAPGPEVKALRRWASDAGFAVQAQMPAGGGITLGDPPIALSSAILQTFDAAIVDARAWAALGGGRAALLGAVRGGMGLLLRADDEAETRALWRGLGLATRGGEGLLPVTLADGKAGGDAALARTRAGIGSRDVPAELNLDEAYLPEVSRLAGSWQGADVVTLLKDAGNHDLAAWRPYGAGRVAAFAVVDSYALTLAGRGDLFARWWSGLLGAVARPAGQPDRIDGPFWAGERAVLCGPGALAQVEQPDGTITRLLPDPAAQGCAGFWPERAGWHRLVDASAARDFYVQPAAALPAVRALRDRAATLRPGPAGALSGVTARAETQARSPWPWFALWLAGCVLLWTLERAQAGRSAKRTGA